MMNLSQFRTFNILGFNFPIERKRKSVPPSKKDTEIAPGVIRPSYALAGMVAGAIIAKCDSVVCRNYMDDQNYKALTGDYAPYWVRKHESTLGHDYCDTCSAHVWEDTVGGKEVKVVSILRGEKPYHLFVFFEGKLYKDWLDIDENLIVESFYKAKEIAKERERERKFTEGQQRATDIIETIFSTPPEPKPEKKMRRVEGCPYSCCNPEMNCADSSAG